ncbi:hypothetical protein KSS87_013807 [Heliosperma pusillum]|nr:hypothetical protein KSS87_013807 [Heliosperma pusillum]
MACSKSSKKMEDFFVNVPDIVIDKILEKLPIRMAAQTSVLSRQWRHAWLSLERLTFDFDFEEQQENKDGSCNWQKISCIISSILLRHNGPVHDFYLFVPDDAEGVHMNLSQWISFLSKNRVQKIVIDNSDGDTITSYIFWCSELVYLELASFVLNPPPTCFHGFPKLKHLELLNIEFTKENIFSSLIKNCRTLVTLKLVNWTGMDHVVIDAPCLKTLILKGDFDSLAFINVRSLERISLHSYKRLEKLITAKTVDAVNLLATYCPLQSIEFNGRLCEFLAAGGNMRSTSVTFNHLDELCLSYLNLNDFAVFHYLLSMIECCAYIKTFDISGITGSTAELKLVEYLLAISPVLENVFFKSGECDNESELKMSRALMGFPRTSPKARLFFREKLF